MKTYQTTQDAKSACNRFVTFVINYYDSLGYEFPAFDGKVADVRGCQLLARPDYRLLFDKWETKETLESAKAGR